jgi:hypothetical protein
LYCRKTAVGAAAWAGGRWTKWPVKKNLSEIALDTCEKFFCPAGLGVFTIEADEEAQALECYPLT